MTTLEAMTVELFKQQGVDLVATLPCDRLKNLLPLIGEHFFEIQLSREEDGVGICAGAYLSGAKPLMLIQSTGIGNLLNALSSLHFTYELPLPIIASWRGIYRESIPAQLYWGSHLKAVLNALDARTFEVHVADDLRLIADGIRAAYETSLPTVTLVSPQVWHCSPQEGSYEVKYKRGSSPSLSYETPFEHATLTRYEAIRAAVAHLRGRIVVSNLGVPSKELYALCDQSSNFYMLGSMGLASSIGLGISLCNRREVIVLDGDGSLLMNPNALCSVSQLAHDNLTILALDNGTYGSTGNQQTASQKLDLELLARAFGIEHTCKAYTADDITASLHTRVDGPKFIHAVVQPGNADVPNLPCTAREIKNRFIGDISKTRKHLRSMRSGKQQ
ncbi:MAG: sulfopyruvate decarboxylase subunit beta [Halobacteriota archaeon]